MDVADDPQHPLGASAHLDHPQRVSANDCLFVGLFVCLFVGLFVDY